MAAYLVKYHLRKDLEGLTNSEAETVFPKSVRVSASDARRAQGAAVKALASEGIIKKGLAELKLVEVKVVG